MERETVHVWQINKPKSEHFPNKFDLNNLLNILCQAHIYISLLCKSDVISIPKPPAYFIPPPSPPPPHLLDCLPYQRFIHIVYAYIYEFMLYTVCPTIRILIKPILFSNISVASTTFPTYVILGTLHNPRHIPHLPVKSPNTQVESHWEFGRTLPTKHPECT